jgi:hypothetical protein
MFCIVLLEDTPSCTIARAIFAANKLKNCVSSEVQIISDALKYALKYTIQSASSGRSHVVGADGRNRSC